MDDTQLRQGLYPRPPDLSQPGDRSPAETFWVIKHGMKMSAMPAWGATHTDDTLWGIVAFVQRLPLLSISEYAALTPRATHDHDSHRHDDADRPGDGAERAPGATIGRAADESHAHEHPEGAVHDH